MLNRQIKEKITWLLLLILAITCLCILTSCKKTAKDALAAPANVQIQDDILTWDEVENAEGYLIDIDGQEYESETNRLDVFTVLYLPKTYEIKVMALGDWELYSDSEWTKPIEYTLEAPTGITLRPINDGAEYEIAAANTSLSGKLVIPATYTDGKPITRIANDGFLNCTRLTGVLIPNTVREIGGEAFYNCTRLKRASLPSSLETIGPFAFYNCAALNTLEIPHSVSKIGLGAFQECFSLESVALPEFLEEIENILFMECTSLRAVEIPKSVQEIGINVFEFCDSLSSLTVAEGNQVFKAEQNCVIRKEDNVLVVGCNASVIPDGVYALERYAFSGCRNLREFSVPGSVETIGLGAFTGCTNLETITFSEGLKTLGNVIADPGPDEIFYGCTSLTAIDLPASVEFIAADLTNRCAQLTRLTVAEGNPVYRSEGNCIIRNSDNVVVAGCRTSEIPASTTVIGPYAFYGSNVDEFTVPEGVEIIGPYAFSESGLIKIELPDTLKTIEYGAFCTCLNLTDFNLPNGLTKIGVGAFIDCPSLKQCIAIPQSVKEIGDYAFRGCNLRTFILPESVETIGQRVFVNSTIYTDARRDGDHAFPEGWITTDTARYSWYAWCTMCTACDLGYDNGIPYVISFEYISTYNNTETGEYRIGTLSKMDKMSIPEREGYTFAGWTTEEGSEVIVSGVSLVVPSDPIFKPYYETLKREDIEKLISGTTLYAVWIPNKSSENE